MTCLWIERQLYEGETWIRLVFGLVQNFFDLDCVGFQKFPPKITIFSIFSIQIKKSHRAGCWVKKYWVKDGSVSYILQVKSMFGSGQGPSL